MKKQIKYILHAKEWFDKVNGNSYFSARVTRIKDGLVLPVQFQYGYGDHYVQMSTVEMKKAGWIKQDVKYLPWEALECIKEQNCKMKDVKAWGK